MIGLGDIYKKKSFYTAERERVRCCGTTREKFLDYLKNTLIPTLHEGDIVIMDNMRTHHVKEVQTLLQRAGMKLLYLPAYSPDLNPIENMWSKIKAILRKLKIGRCPCFLLVPLKLSR